MGSSRRTRALAWLAVVAAVALATWWVGSPESGPLAASAGSGSGRDLTAAPSEAGPRIEAGGRLTIDRRALPGDGPLLLSLAVPDEGRGSALTGARVVSTDGRRLDTTAAPLPGSGTGVQLGVDPEFLTRGRYLIEVDTVSRSPLRVQRFVLEVR